MRLDRTITAIDAHAGGEPGRVIIDGVSDVPDATIFEKRDHLATPSRRASPSATCGA